MRDPEPNRNKKHSPFRGSEFEIQAKKPSLAWLVALRAPLRRTARAARGTFDGRFEPRFASHAIASRARLGQPTSICLAHTGRAARDSPNHPEIASHALREPRRETRSIPCRSASRTGRAATRETRADFTPICLAHCASRARRFRSPRSASRSLREPRMTRDDSRRSASHAARAARDSS